MKSAVKWALVSIGALVLVLGAAFAYIKLTGALESPQYSIDFASMATDFAKRELQEELLGRVTGRSADGKQQSKAARPEDLIKDRLKGILGR